MADQEGDVRVPEAYDISGSADWYNKSDNIITVFRRKFHTEIHIQKIRFREIGQQGQIKLRYEPDLRGYTEKFNPSKKEEE